MGKTKLKDGDRKLSADGKRQIYEVYDEWEHADIDRDEQKAGLKRRAKRWRDMELEEIRIKKMEELAIKKVEKVKELATRDPNELEKAWLRCDYVLSHIMDKNAYDFMETARINDPELYKKLYRIFMSRHMMENIGLYIDYFDKGGISPIIVTYGDVIKTYRKIKGIKSIITIKHKNEEELEL